MKTKRINTVFLFLCFLSQPAFSQPDCLTEPPLPPVLTSVSVQQETGNTIFRWTISQSGGIAAYILYSYNNGDGLAIDTIWDPAATSYTLVSTATKYFSVSYVLAAMRLPRCTSVFSNVLNTIFEEAVIDTCLKKIAVKWNNYPSLPVKVNSYTLFYSVNGGSFIPVQVPGSDVTGFSFSNFTVNANYCFFIHANLTDGSVSSSNKVCLSTEMQRPPLWINADEATVNSDDNVDISFTIDPQSEIRQFRLERKSGEDGEFQLISQHVASQGSFFYTDTQADIHTVNYYRLSAINSCGLPVTVSNIASNIVLTSAMSENDIVLTWNPYRSWLGGIESYKLSINTGKGFEEKAVINSEDSAFVLGYNQIMYDISGKEVCFCLLAAEGPNQHNVSGRSKSEEICVAPIEKITVPNLFTPDNDLKNDFFKPFLSFTPLKYHLIISNMQGNIVFETRDYLQAWDGTMNGIQQPQTICLWFLKLKTPSGTEISRSGTVTIIRKK